MYFLLQLSGFFKGMYYPLLSAGALNSLFFGVYGVTLRSMTENREETNVGLLGISICPALYLTTFV